MTSILICNFAINLWFKQRKDVDTDSVTSISLIFEHFFHCFVLVNKMWLILFLNNYQNTLNWVGYYDYGSSFSGTTKYMLTDVIHKNIELFAFMTGVNWLVHGEMTSHGLCFLYNLEGDGLHSNQSFIARPWNARRWQEEAITPTVLELKCERVFDAKVVRPVIGSARSQVWRKTSDTNVNFIWYIQAIAWKITPTYILSVLQDHTGMCSCNTFWFSRQLLGLSQALKKEG